MPEDAANQPARSLPRRRPVFLVNGLITDCGRLVREHANHGLLICHAQRAVSARRQKTMAWSWPSSLAGICRTSSPLTGGGPPHGMWKAFQELRELGWLQSEKMPRLISCQSDGCAPIVRAFESGQRFAEPFANARTIASGLRVPAAVGDFMMLDAIRASGGCAIAGKEDRIVHWMRRAIGLEGISICPETAVCFDCLEQLRQAGKIGPDDEVVVFNTGAAQKYPEAVQFSLPKLDKNRPVDYQELTS